MPEKRQLSPRSSVDVLKQDAKRWLKSIRADDPDARRRLAEAWPASPDAPNLRDVQHALAREYGFADWKSLLAALDDIALDRQSHAERVDAVLQHGWNGHVSVARRIAARYPDVARDSIFTAATCGDIDEVRRRLTSDPSLATAKGGALAWPAIAYVAFGRVDDANAVGIARLLLDAGSDVHFAHDDGWGNPFTLITGAIGLGEGVKRTHPQAVTLVELFIERGAEPFDTQALYNSSIVDDDPFWTDFLWRHCERRGETPRWSRVDGPGLGGRIKVGTLNYLLGNAVANNHLARAEWLLAHGAAATTPHAYSGQPVHTQARLAGFTEMAALLVRHGAQPEGLDGHRALLAALMEGDEREVRARVAADPSLLAGGTLLIAAAGHGNAAAVALLLELGADAQATDHEGATALHRAAQAGSVATVDTLLAAGADVGRRDPRWQGTAMSWAVALGRDDVAERLAPVTRDVRALVRIGRVERLAEVLREEPALANHRLTRVDDPTPLFCLPDDEEAAAEVTATLLEHGADPQVKNPAGKTPSEVARMRGLERAAALIDAKGGRGAQR